MKGHRAWLIPLCLIPAIFLGCVVGIYAVAAQPGYQDNVGLGVLNLLLLVLAFLGPLVALVFTIVGAARVWRRSRRRKGYLTSVEKIEKKNTAQSQSAWAAAVELRQHLLARAMPATVAVWEIVPQPGETMLLDLPADYARYYGRDVSYAHKSGFFYGHPAFVLAGMAASSIGNSARRNAAAAEAQSQWREWQTGRVVVTNQRLVCFVGGRWLSFYYSAITALYPDAAKWALVCEFGDTVPLMLTGTNVPLMSVITVLMTHGEEGLARHPGLQALDPVPAS